jgi:hypothetical protein
MAFIRVQKRGNRQYYYLVKSERQGNKVRQRVLKYMGTSKPSKADIQATITRIHEKRGRGNIL